MKLFTITLLLASSQAYLKDDISKAVPGETCSKEEPNCKTDTNVCVERTVNSVASPAWTNYKNQLAKDKDLVKDNVSYKCYAEADADTAVAKSGTKETSTSVTATYVKLERVDPPPEPPKTEEKKEGAIKMTLGAASAAALMALTF